MTKEEKVEKLLEVARAQIGKAYQYGACYEEGTEDEQSFDCSSFTQFCFRQIGIEIPRSSVLQAAAQIGREIDGFAEPVALGDLVFFEGERGHFRHDLFPGRKIYIGHVAIFSGDSRIIHACNNSVASGVVETSLITLPNPPYKIVMVKRLI
jgi:cell wall-associated NlpC family hydrolase